MRIYTIYDMQMTAAATKGFVCFSFSLRALQCKHLLVYGNGTADPDIRGMKNRFA